MNQRIKNWFLITTLMLIAAAFLGACDALPWASTRAEPTPLPPVIESGSANAEGRLVPVRYTILGFQKGGEVGEVAVEEGDLVTAGDSLVKLGKIEALQAGLSQARLEQVSAQQALDELYNREQLSRQEANQALIQSRVALNQAETALNDLDTDQFQEELDDLNIAVDDAKQELDDAKETLDKNLDLDPDNARRKNAQADYDDALRAYNEAVYERNDKQYQLDQAKAAVDLASAKVDDAQRQYNNRSDGIDSDTLALAQARLDAADAQMAAAQRTLDETSLVAPFDSMVVELHDLQPGDQLLPAQNVVTLADYSTWMVDTRDLTELDVVNVEIGQNVEVTPDALPDIVLKGVVESIDRTFTERSGDILYTVRIRLTEGDSRLRWGMTVNVVFEP